MGSSANAVVTPLPFAPPTLPSTSPMPPSTPPSSPPSTPPPLNPPSPPPLNPPSPPPLNPPSTPPPSSPPAPPVPVGTECDCSSGEYPYSNGVHLGDNAGCFHDYRNLPGPPLSDSQLCFTAGACPHAYTDATSEPLEYISYWLVKYPGAYMTRCTAPPSPPPPSPPPPSPPPPSPPPPSPPPSTPPPSPPPPSPPPPSPPPPSPTPPPPSPPPPSPPPPSPSPPPPSPPPPSPPPPSPPPPSPPPPSPPPSPPPPAPPIPDGSDQCACTTSEYPYSNGINIGTDTGCFYDNNDTGLHVNYDSSVRLCFTVGDCNHAFKNVPTVQDPVHDYIGYWITKHPGAHVLPCTAPPSPPPPSPPPPSPPPPSPPPSPPPPSHHHHRHHRLPRHHRRRHRRHHHHHHHHLPHHRHRHHRLPRHHRRHHRLPHHHRRHHRPPHHHHSPPPPSPPPPSPPPPSPPPPSPPPPSPPPPSPPPSPPPPSPPPPSPPPPSAPPFSPAGVDATHTITTSGKVTLASNTAEDLFTLLQNGNIGHGRRMDEAILQSILVEQYTDFTVESDTTTAQLFALLRDSGCQTNCRVLYVNTNEYRMTRDITGTTVPMHELPSFMVPMTSPILSIGDVYIKVTLTYISGENSADEFATQYVSLLSEYFGTTFSAPTDIATVYEKDEKITDSEIALASVMSILGFVLVAVIVYKTIKLLKKSKEATDVPSDIPTLTHDPVVTPTGPSVIVPTDMSGIPPV
ncbi:hypothetical protein EQVG_00108 [Emiliania huxleyi virus 207]|nr:hypothetical protein EQVG_00108 [Emiliania huxleyi virus 207]